MGKFYRDRMGQAEACATTNIMRFYLMAVMTFAAVAQTPPPSPESTPHVFTGTLFDAARHDCGAEVHNATPSGTCPVSMTTRDFGITQADGKYVVFDEGGNQKAIDALKRSKKGSQIVIAYWKTGKTSAAVTAQVSGTLTSDTLNVSAIKID